MHDYDDGFVQTPEGAAANQKTKGIAWMIGGVALAATGLGAIAAVPALWGVIRYGTADANNGVGTRH
jgi:hypothetical protein